MNALKKYLIKLFWCGVKGAAHSGSAWLGVAVGHSAFADVPMLGWKALGCVCLTSTVVSLFKFIDETPAPVEYADSFHGASPNSDGQPPFPLIGKPPEQP